MSLNRGSIHFGTHSACIVMRQREHDGSTAEKAGPDREMMLVEGYEGWEGDEPVFMMTRLLAILLIGTEECVHTSVYTYHKYNCWRISY